MTPQSESRLALTSKDAKGLKLLLVMFYVSPRTSLAVLFMLLVSGVAEGLGLATFVPLFSMLLTEDGGLPTDTLSRAFAGGLAAIHIEPGVVSLLVVVVLFFWLKAATFIAARVTMGTAAARFATDLRSKLMDALVHARWEYFKGKAVGDLANAMTTEVGAASGALNSAFDFTSTVPQVVVYLVLSLVISWQLTLGGLAASVVIWMLFHRFVVLVRAAGNQQRDSMDTLVNRLVDQLVGIKPIKAMAAEDQFSPMVATENEGMYLGLRGDIVNRSMMTGLGEPVLVTLLALTAIAAETIARVPLATLMVTGMVLYRTASTVMRLQQRYQVLAAIEGYVHAILSEIEDARAARESHPGTRVPKFAKAITIADLWYSFGSHSVLKGANLTIDAGRITAVHGPSGSGKTTLIDLVIGLYSATRGSIRIDDQPIETLDIAAWRRMVGYVPQDVLLFNDTLLANVTLSDPALTRADAEAALRRAGAWDFVTNMERGLDGRVGERGQRLSGGQRQRIAIARALVRKPRLLILDEPTTALDPATEAEICATLRSLAGETAVLVVSHQKALVEIADRVFRMSDGCVLTGSPAAAPADIAALR